MQNYELTVVLTGGLTQAKKKSFVGKLEKLIELLKGKIDKTDEWGETELYYKIKGQINGIFMHFNLELDSKSVKALKDNMKSEDDVIRHLLVKKEK